MIHTMNLRSITGHYALSHRAGSHHRLLSQSAHDTRNLMGTYQGRFQWSSPQGIFNQS